jgi:hypothetical protein
MLLKYTLKNYNGGFTNRVFGDTFSTKRGLDYPPADKTKNTQREVITVRKFVVLAVSLAVMVFLVAPATLALADTPQEKIDMAVAPVIGGPDNPERKTTPATVSIPSNNPAIATGCLPGNVFIPAGPF